MTRRIIGAIILAVSFQQAHASLYWCHMDGMFFSHPRPEVHDNLEYDALARKYITMMVSLQKTYKCNPDYALKMVKVHAERELLAFPNPTRQKFVEDLSSIKQAHDILDIMGVPSWDASI